MSFTELCLSSPESYFSFDDPDPSCRDRGTSKLGLSDLIAFRAFSSPICPSNGRSFLRLKLERFELGTKGGNFLKVISYSPAPTIDVLYDWLGDSFNNDFKGPKFVRLVAAPLNSSFDCCYASSSFPVSCVINMRCLCERRSLSGLDCSVHIISLPRTLLDPLISPCSRL